MVYGKSIFEDEFIMSSDKYYELNVRINMLLTEIWVVGNV